MKKYKELFIKQTGKESSRSNIFNEFKVYNKSNKLLASDIDMIRIHGKVYIDYYIDHKEVSKIHFFGIVSYTIDCGILAIHGDE